MLSSLSGHFQDFSCRLVANEPWLFAALIGVVFTVAGLSAALIIGVRLIDAQKDN